jgi:hypothetical protein
VRKLLAKKPPKMLRHPPQAVAQAIHAFPIISWSAVKLRVQVEHQLVQLRLLTKQLRSLPPLLAAAYLLVPDPEATRSGC